MSFLKTKALITLLLPVIVVVSGCTFLNGEKYDATRFIGEWNRDDNKMTLNLTADKKVFTTGIRSNGTYTVGNNTITFNTDIGNVIYEYRFFNANTTLVLTTLSKDSEMKFNKVK